MSYARLVAKLERYDAYRNAPPSGPTPYGRTSGSRRSCPDPRAHPQVDGTLPPPAPTTAG
ncbi:hypothetical protein ACW4TU_09755 [Streptomyces sp. QTS52]